MSLTLPFRRVLASRAGAYSAEALAFFARLASPPSPQRKTRYDTLIRALVGAGVWAKLDALYVFAAADQASALTNLVQAPFGATAVNSPSFSADLGFTFATTRYIDTTFNPATAGGLFAQDNASVFGWGDNVGGITSGLINSGIFSNNPGGTEIAPRWTSDVFLSSLNNDNQQNTANLDGSGLSLLSRTASTGYAVYRNGSLFASKTVASSPPQSNTLVVGNERTATRPYTGNILAIGFGAGLSAAEQAALYDALHAYLQATAGIP